MQFRSKITDFFILIISVFLKVLFICLLLHYCLPPIKKLYFYRYPGPLPFILLAQTRKLRLTCISMKYCARHAASLSNRSYNHDRKTTRMCTRHKNMNSLMPFGQANKSWFRPGFAMQKKQKASSVVSSISPRP